MFQRETAVLGTLYALGYRSSELLRHYLLFPLTIAGAGGLLGTLLGVAMVKPKSKTGILTLPSLAHFLQAPGCN